MFLLSYSVTLLIRKKLLIVSGPSVIILPYYAQVGFVVEANTKLQQSKFDKSTEYLIYGLFSTKCPILVWLHNRETKIEHFVLKRKLLQTVLDKTGVRDLISLNVHTGTRLLF